MSEQFIVAISGPDRPDLTRALAVATHERGGNWLNSKFIRLAGRFAALIRVEVPAQQADAVREVFSALQDCQVDFHEVAVVREAALTRYVLSVDAEDRPGLVSDITHLLQERQVTIQDIDCHRMVVSGLGSSMFRGEFEVAVPGDVPIADVVADIEALGEQVKVMIEAAKAA